MWYAELEPLDTQVARGVVPRRLPIVPGSGAIVDTGHGPGYVVPGHGEGTLADRIDVPPDHVVPVPEGLDPVVAVGASAVAVARLALFDRAGLRKGETVLVVGASGFVGGAAAQVAAAHGAAVIAAARDVSAVPLRAGIVPVAMEGFAEAVAERTSGQGADVVIDVVGGPTLGDVIAAGGIGCRHVLVGTAGGAVTQVVLPRLLASEHRLMGFRRSATRPEALLGAHREALADLAAERVRLPEVPRVPLGDPDRAFAEAAEHGHAVVVGAAAHP